MIVNYNELPKIRKKHKNDKIVMLKGTFDLFHIGHLNLLKRAKSLGDVLVVVLKCDEVVKLKSDDRPIIDETNRALIVDSIVYTDYTIIANQKFFIDNDIILSENDRIQYQRYSKIINELKPDILVKQPNHDIPVPLLQLYKKYSTQIIEIDRTKGISTTELIEKIRR